MGYRSDVAFVASFDSEEKADKFWGCVMLEISEDQELLTEVTSTFQRFKYPKSDCVHFIYSVTDIKWYGGRGIVELMEEYMMGRYVSSQVTKCGGGYNFVRIGEEENDIEANSDYSSECADYCVGEMYDIFQLRRYIEMNAAGVDTY